jgi:transposase
MWDNLSSHFSDEAYASIYFAGHDIIERTPYNPWDGPIEYVFNQIEVRLKTQLYHIRNNQDLYRELMQILGNLHNVAGTFQHCGY